MIITTIPLSDFNVPVKPGQIFERPAAPITFMVSDAYVIKVEGSKEERRKAVSDFRASHRRYKRNQRRVAQILARDTAGNA